MCSCVPAAMHTTHGGGEEGLLYRFFLLRFEAIYSEINNNTNPS